MIGGLGTVAGAGRDGFCHTVAEVLLERRSVRGCWNWIVMYCSVGPG